jgi:hypothetical protein
MLKRILLLTYICSIFFQNYSKADEGMWLPLLLKKLNEADMQKEGFRLTADDIYNINHSSMKDAIVRLGGGFCTAEMISGEGLLLTNHHCGYESVQEHSSVAHDYLTDGFWAKTHEEELSNMDLTADFLVSIQDVTERVMKEISDTLTESQRTAAIQKLASVMAKEVSDSNGLKGELKSFFKGNTYYLFVYQIFRDVRLVGAPPSAIGKFGGDTDNWMWPRHTGDFTLFRVYMSKDGKPAPYSKDNIPFKPKYFLPVSLEGVKKDDFAMVMGYPGGTDRYLISDGVKLAIEVTNPAIIKIREKKLAIIKEDMNSSKDIRIKYSSKYYESSNYYKYYIGQSKGLVRMDVVDKKKQEENNFTQWANSDPIRKVKYGSTLSQMAKNYSDIRKYSLAHTYFGEAVFQGPEIMLQAYRCNALAAMLSDKNSKPEDIKKAAEELKKESTEFYMNYNAPTDQKLFSELLKMYYDNVPSDQHPAVFGEVVKKYKGDFNEYAKYIYKKTIFADSSRFFAFLNDPAEKKLKKDPAFQAMNSILENYIGVIVPASKKAELDNAKLYRNLVAGLMEMSPERKFYPDANSTMRLSYGRVEDYYPMDAVYYNYFTTLQGVMEKKDSTNDEFTVPRKLEELYKKKDYGNYGVNGQMNVCFITDNDITGGNSGSPVINGKGELIGIAFDGNWEAMSGDIAFDPVYKRCINVDIRYVLFIIDKFAGATNLIHEMKITGDVKSSSLNQIPVNN